MDHPILTITCAFTRRWTVERWLENLANVPHDPAKTNMAFVVDADEPFIKNKLKQFAEAKQYRSFHLRMNDDHFPNEVRLTTRRNRIAEVKNQSKDLIAKCDGHFVLGLEDDTVFPDLNLSKLIDPFIDPQVGFIEGVQCGRWGIKIIGAWSADDFEYPQKVWTMVPGEGREEIDGGGFYGYVTRKELYLNHEYFASSAQPWGPDVNYGLWLRNRGYKCYIHWPTVFGHDDHGKILYPDDKVSQAIYTKNAESGKWDREDHENISRN